MGVISNYILDSMGRNTKRSIIALWSVQDTEVVCHKKSPLPCLIQFVFICLHEFNEVSQREFPVGSGSEKYYVSQYPRDSTSSRRRPQLSSLYLAGRDTQLSDVEKLKASGCGVFNFLKSSVAFL